MRFDPVTARHHNLTREAGFCILTGCGAVHNTPPKRLGAAAVRARPGLNPLLSDGLRMLKSWIKSTQKKRRTARRQRDFAEGIERYRAEVLEPQGLINEPWESRDPTKNRRIFLGADRVWKFYRPAQKHFARNFAEASRLLIEASIPAPRVLHCGADKETVERYGTACLVMERISGVEASRSDAPDVNAKVGEFLARMHQIRSNRWGNCHDTQSAGGYFAGYPEAEILERLGRAAPFIRAENLDPLPDFLGWFEAHRDRIDPMDGRFSLVSADAHPNNFILREDGTMTIIDLDRTRFLDFPLDLTYFLLRRGWSEFGTGLGDADAADHQDPAGQADRIMDAAEKISEDFLKPYFGTAPPEFRVHWRQVRFGFFTLVLLRQLGSILKPGRYDADSEADPQRAESDAKTNAAAHRMIQVLRRFVRGRIS